MECWLCLAGGNALGAFYVGAWSAIEASDLKITRISGASIGAVVAAVIAGNPPERRSEALRQFLDEIALVRPPWALDGRRQLVTATLFTGNPHLFVPSLPGILEVLPFMPPDISLFRRERMQRLLEKSIDFDLLNNAPLEVTFTALDAETGEIAVFRSSEQRLAVEHIMASTALPGIFQPVEIAGRTFFDPGLCENLPLPSLFDREDDTPILALDLFSKIGPLSLTLNGVADRAQALAFAGQSARIINQSDSRNRKFLHLVLDDPTDQFAGKAFDYSRTSLDKRRRLGEDLTTAALAEWISGSEEAR